MATIERSTIVRLVGVALQSDDRLVAAFVFGSAAADRIAPESDVDVGVLFEAVPSVEVRAEVSDRIAVAIARDVDLVVLNDASPIVVRQVLKGIRVVSRDPGALARFMVRANGAYDDLKRVRRPIELAIAGGLRPHGR